MSKLAHSNDESMRQIALRAAIENGDEDMIEEATCLHCGRFVDGDGVGIDPRGCCFYCKAD